MFIYRLIKMRAIIQMKLLTHCWLLVSQLAFEFKRPLVSHPKWAKLFANCRNHLNHSKNCYLSPLVNIESHQASTVSMQASLSSPQWQLVVVDSCQFTKNHLKEQLAIHHSPFQLFPTPLHSTSSSDLVILLTISKTGNPAKQNIKTLPFLHSFSINF